jgi:uncharacterized protein
MNTDAHSTCASRRGFLRASAAGVLAGASLAPALAADRLPAGMFVDVHTHLGQTWDTTKELTADALLRWMDENAVAQAVVLPLVSPESSSFPLSSDFVLAQTRAHRDRLIPFCCIDPRASVSGLRGLEGMLRRWIDQGAKGFGEHKPGLPIDDARSMRLYSACGRLGLPVLFHIDEQRNTDRPGLPGLEKALKEFPNTTFIGHGPGWWASISGGLKQEDLGKYPKTAVAPGGAIDRLMDTYPNLYGDLSAGSGAGAIARDKAFGPAFLARRADRLMFGTDYLSPGQPVPQFALFKELDLPEPVRAKVSRENARRLLKLG